MEYTQPKDYYMQKYSSQIDLSLLSQPITKDDIERYSNKSERLNLSAKWLYLAVILFLIISVGSNLQLSWLHGQSLQSSGSLWVYVFIAICIACGIAVMVTIGKRNAKRHAILQRFAQNNDIIFKENLTPAGQTGMIFQYGHSRSISQMFAFSNGLEIGNYHYVTGHGKNARSHAWSFASIPLNRAMPHIVLDSKSNNLLRRFTNLPDGFDADQKLSLEGDFDTYFTLYAPQQYKKDLLYLFTPDVMAALMDHGQHYDIEIIDNILYFYNTRQIQLNSEQELRSVLMMIETISDEIVDQNQNYRDERLASEPIDIQKSTIAPQGRRLKRSVDIVALTVWLLLIAFFIYSVTRT